LSPGDRKLLERDGDRHDVEALYRFNFAQKQWMAPALIYSNDDRVCYITLPDETHILAELWISAINLHF